MISIVVPVFNEENNIQNFLEQFDNSSDLEVIVVDGGSTDKTREKIADLTTLDSKITLVSNGKLGRANQMNYGAKLAKSDILLFLHSDTVLPQDYQQTIEFFLKQKEVIIGAFQLKINSPKKALRIIEYMVNWRSRLLALPYGDQGLFLTKANFQLLGGFAELPIMEDFDLVQRAKKYGKIAIASSKVVTSDRRWQKLGVAKTTIINQLVIVGYYFQIAPDKLRKFYSSSTIKHKL